MRRLVFRKWGWYLVILNGRYFKVKLLRFNGKRPLSMQFHNLRNELWLFLRGQNKGTWRVIHRNKLHTFAPYKPTYVLEIQYGDKCSEDDIVRI